MYHNLSWIYNSLGTYTVPFMTGTGYSTLLPAHQISNISGETLKSILQRGVTVHTLSTSLLQSPA